ncbi:hypothetical protein RUR49_19065 [Pseudoxanthobacter sp. M-2]|uniref:hypothetical protein n=1 Tax=Pseudoxanthobacter sp. M-2 TaxID=3078754 RepID=UPI0038FCBCD2
MILQMIRRGRGLPDLEKALQGISGKQAHVIMGRAVRREGNKVRTQVVNALVRQTGAGRHAVLKALSYEGTRRAKGGLGTTPSGLEYRIDAKGRYLPLTAFKPRETKRGVSAAPWGTRQIFASTFFATMKSGHRGVFKREGSGRTPIAELWGPSIPAEMLKDDSRAAFDRGTEGITGRIIVEVARQANLKMNRR